MRSKFCPGRCELPSWKTPSGRSVVADGANETFPLTEPHPLAPAAAGCPPARYASSGVHPLPQKPRRRQQEQHRTAPIRARKTEAERRVEKNNR